MIKPFFVANYAINIPFFNEAYPYTYAEAQINATKVADKLRVSEEFISSGEFRSLTDFKAKIDNTSCIVKYTTDFESNHTGLFIILNELAYVRAANNCEPSTYRNYDNLVSSFINSNMKILSTWKKGKNNETT